MPVGSKRMSDSDGIELKKIFITDHCTGVIINRLFLLDRDRPDVAMSSIVDIRVRNSKKKEADLDSRIHNIVFPEVQDILFDQVLDQMMMDG